VHYNLAFHTFHQPHLSSFSFAHFPLTEHFSFFSLLSLFSLDRNSPLLVQVCSFLLQPKHLPLLSLFLLSWWLEISLHSAIFPLTETQLTLLAESLQSFKPCFDFFKLFSAAVTSLFPHFKASISAPIRHHSQPLEPLLWEEPKVEG
jgi:hypothetical protein